MVKKTGDGKLDALRALYGDNEHARAILEDFAGRTNNQRITEVEQIMRRLSTAELPRWAVIKLFRGLGELGYGRFIEGRRGHPSRFRWSASLIDIGKAAKGETLDITSDVGEEESAESDLVEHQFNLRAGMVVTIELPADFSEKEAERLSGFLRSLPL
jgi:hypothetical protein